MKTINQDLRHEVLKLKVENLDDAWHLKKILETGDLLTGRTFRKTSVKSGGEVKEGDRKSMTLTIEVEKVEYRSDMHTLRVHGKITAGPDDVQLSSYHTISIEQGMIISIEKKKWKKYQLDRIQKAGGKKPLLFICVLDRENADFAILQESGIKMLGSVRSEKTETDDKRQEYYENVMKTLKDQGCDTIIIAGPGFERENVFKLIKEKDTELAKKISIEHANDTGKPGVQEVIETSANRVLKDTRVAKETEFVQEVLTRIKKEGLVTYGKKEVKKAIDMGAVETLLVSEEKIEDFEPLMDMVENQRGKVVIISIEHESGEEFLGLGGIAGLLRYKINQA
jgi:protein pelota